jgi:hypothetical protein
MKFAATVAALAGSAWAIDVDKLLNSMTLEEKIGQLNQITINEFLSAPAQVNYTKVCRALFHPLSSSGGGMDFKVPYWVHLRLSLLWGPCERSVGLDGSRMA